MKQTIGIDRVKQEAQAILEESFRYVNDGDQKKALKTITDRIENLIKESGGKIEDNDPQQEIRNQLNLF